VADDDEPNIECPWRVQVADSSLPSTLAHDKAFVPLMPGEKQKLNSGVRLQVLDHGLRRGETRALWEDALGKVKAVSERLASGESTELPRKTATLHLFATSRPDHQLQTFLKNVGTTYQFIATKPRFLNLNVNQVSGKLRGVGDNIKIIPSASKKIAWPKSSALQHCKFVLTF
jgi:hypothetical protein